MFLKVMILNGRQHYTKDYELVFLFASPSAPMPYARRRRDGTKFSHSEWAEKNKFKWYSEKTFPEEWT